MIFGMVWVWSSVLCARRIKLIMIAGRNYVVEIFVLKMPIKAKFFNSISGLMWKVIISILTKAQNPVLECHPPTSITPIPTMSFPKKGRVRKVRISFVFCRFPTTTTIYAQAHANPSKKAGWIIVVGGERKGNLANCILSRAWNPYRVPRYFCLINKMGKKLNRRATAV